MVFLHASSTKSFLSKFRARPVLTRLATGSVALDDIATDTLTRYVALEMNEATSYGPSSYNTLTPYGSFGCGFRSWVFAEASISSVLSIFLSVSVTFSLGVWVSVDGSLCVSSDASS